MDEGPLVALIAVVVRFGRERNPDSEQKAMGVTHAGRDPMISVVTDMLVIGVIVSVNMVSVDTLVVGRRYLRIVWPVAVAVGMREPGQSASARQQYGYL